MKLIDFWTTAHDIPDVSGAYVLAIDLSEPVAVSICGKPSVLLAPGPYLYCGSANGPGGLRARLARHMRHGKPIHWHIDCLTEAGTVLGAWTFLCGDECNLVAALSHLPIAVKGFGSTDCRRCTSHLLRWPHGAGTLMTSGGIVMRLNSSAFADGSAIPRRFTCDGDDLSPPLSWSDAPPGTRSFVLLCDDPDAPAGTWHHWAAYDIPSTLTALAERAASDAEKRGFKQAVNDFQRPGYGGPCPPRGHGPHHYHFRLLALSVDRLPVGRTPSCREVEREARKHTITEATLVGVYQR